MAERGLFSGVFGRGDIDTGYQAWLAAIAADASAAADAAAGLAAAHRDTVMIGRTLL